MQIELSPEEATALIRAEDMAQRWMGQAMRENGPLNPEGLAQLNHQASARARLAEALAAPAPG